MSGRNSSITRAARDCESRESLRRKSGRVAAVTAWVPVARQWRIESRVQTPSSQLGVTTGPGTRKGRRLLASAFHITPRSGDFETGGFKMGERDSNSNCEVMF